MPKSSRQKSKLKLWRESVGLSQREVADLVGVDETYLCQIETGARKADS